MKKQILKLLVHRNGVSPVIGVILMLVLTILLAGITVTAVYGADAVSSLKKAPMASIEVEHAEGSAASQVAYDKSFIHLVHMGGDPLDARSTRIIITGEGSAYEGVVPTGTRHNGNILISYDNLLFNGKESAYASRNPALSDGMWSAGEILILNGPDAISSGPASTVSVSINEVMDTANNYGLKEDSWLTVKIFDKDTQRIISESECLVHLPD
ncbi:type IV pilin N-terminal domain-containing protein [Methanolobus sp. WCC4]|uniref:type IV pilin N-terminal domain-containing protein n=1 Tax=Methanolobus sp. WCC4 TaxID=3125784 RepID=UPI0030FC7D4C